MKVESLMETFVMTMVVFNRKFRITAKLEFTKPKSGSGKRRFDTSVANRGPKPLSSVLPRGTVSGP